MPPAGKSAKGAPAAPPPSRAGGGAKRTIMDLKKSAQEAFAKSRIREGMWTPPVGEYVGRMVSWTEEEKATRKDKTPYLSLQLKAVIVGHPDPDLDGREVIFPYDTLGFEDQDTHEMRYPRMDDLKTDAAALIGRDQAEALTLSDLSTGFAGMCENQEQFTFEIDSYVKKKTGKVEKTRRITGLVTQADGDDEAPAEGEEEAGPETEDDLDAK